MQHLTPEAIRVVQDVARRHGVSEAAVGDLLAALAAGGGRQAQFNHPDLGGMGQWSAGGMIMVGDMFDSVLKARVDALCTELAGLLREQGPLASPAPVQSGHSQSGHSQSGHTGDAWWPAELGAPSSSGAQNGMRYAYFPALRRLAIDANGQLTVYDTAEHAFRGFSQQQSGDRSLVFTSQHGPVRLADLAVAEQTRASSHPSTSHPSKGPSTHSTAPASGKSGSDREDVFDKIERLAELHQKGVLSEAEFTDKKRELLARI